MNRHPRTSAILRVLAALCLLILSACQPAPLPSPSPILDLSSPTPSPTAPSSISNPQSTRPFYLPGELVDYVAQSGDTLPALAVHFNTTVEEILAANSFIPKDATTMPPGMPMKIPIYYLPLWGTPYQILPDSLFINGPAQIGFDVRAFIADHPGWLKDSSDLSGGFSRSGAEIVEIVARNFSVSPRLLLALLEYQSGALSQPTPPPADQPYILGYVDRAHQGLNLQLVWAANTLNNGYYGYRSGELTTLTRQDGSIEHPDPWQNAATVALQYYFSLLLPPRDYPQAVEAEGFAKTYRDLFGDPWQADQPHLPGSLTQPEMKLPFAAGESWALTGGPHTGWGVGPPWAALDFAPPSVVGGCAPSEQWVRAVASGKVIRSEPGVVVLDLDADGEERSGWTIFYLHLGSEGRAPVGAQLETGAPLGHPSCEGGSSTGTHVHIARKYNGEWMPAAGILPFDLEGWVAYNGAEAYKGGMKRYARTVVACVCSNAASQIQAGER